MIWFLADSPAQGQHISHQMARRGKLIHLYVMQFHKRLRKQTIRTHVHLKIAITCPIFMKVNQSKPIELLQHHEVHKARFIVESILLVENSCQKLDQSAVVVHVLATAYERKIRIFAKAKAARSTMPSLSVPALGPFRENRAKTLTETVSHLLAFQSVRIKRKCLTSKQPGTARDTRTQRTAVVS